MNELSFDDKKERAVRLGEYIIDHKATVRMAAKAYGISKSTVHMDGTKQKILWQACISSSDNDLTTYHGVKWYVVICLRCGLITGKSSYKAEWR